MDAKALKCILCPNTPTFSDVSHLLTHISSKGHLAHQFKLKVRSSSEPEVGEQLASYDLWFSEHGLGNLLAERLQSKRARRGGTRCRSRRSVPPRRVGHRSAPVAVLKEESQDDGPQGVLDPRLSQTHFEDTKNIGYGPSSARLPLPTPHGLDIRTGTLYSGQLDYDHDDSFHEDGPIQQSPSAYPDPLELASLAEAPSQIGDGQSDSTLDQSRLSRGISETVYTEMGGDVGDRNDEPVLKGTTYEGMGMFDSATDEMRRKRNQRKDVSILEQMEITSALVEPAEIIYSPSGEVKKTRLITGYPEISSPLKGESPLVVKKRTTRSRQPLGEGDPNITARPRRRAKKSDYFSNNDTELRELSRQTLPFLESSSPVRNLRRVRRRKNNDDGDDEYKLTTRSFSLSRRRFDIFEDETSRTRTPSDKQPASYGLSGLPQMASYGHFSSTQSRTYFDVADSPMPMQNNMPAAGPSNYSMLTGSNVQGAAVLQSGARTPVSSHMNESVRFEPPSSAGERITQRYFAMEDGGQPQFFNSSNPHLDFGFMAPHSRFGFTMNPVHMTLGYQHHQTRSISPLQNGPNPQTASSGLSPLRSFRPDPSPRAHQFTGNNRGSRSKDHMEQYK